MLPSKLRKKFLEFWKDERGFLTNLTFILGYSVFLFFVLYMTALMGTSGVITNVPTDVEIPNCSEASLPFFCVLSNIGFFFELMKVSSGYAILGTVLFTPLLIALVWVVLSLLRGSD